MKNNTYILLPLTIIFSLTGCSNTEPEEIHTVDWFLKNQSTMNNTVNKCKNIIGELAGTPNCINALSALKISNVGTPEDLNKLF